MAIDSCPWTRRAGVQCRGIPQVERYADCLNVGFQTAHLARPDAEVKDLVQDLWVDPSQNVGRLPCGHQLWTLTKNTVLYNYGKDCTLSGHGHLCLMGWPKHFGPKELFSDGECRQLAGESYSAPICLLIMDVMYTNPYGPWWPQPVNAKRGA